VDFAFGRLIIILVYRSRRSVSHFTKPRGVIGLAEYNKVISRPSRDECHSEPELA
jgi:hypothetical protein